MDVAAFTHSVCCETDAELEQEMLTLNAHMSAATYRFLVLVRTFDERVAWGDWGMRSMAHWLNWRCGIELGTAREQVRVAHALARLPRTSEALAHGRVSYSKVRAFSRVAIAENEDFFLDIAEHGTASHMETIVRHVKRGLAVDEAARAVAMLERCTCDWYHDDDGMLVLHARLMPDAGARLINAVRALEAGDSSVPLAARRAQALATVAESAVAQDGKVVVPEIVVHMQVEGASGEASSVIEDATAIPATTVARLCCDAAVVPMLEDARGEPLSIGRRSRTIPPAIRRVMNARDKGCRFPGCTHTRFLHGHHIQHWAQQGETSLENLVTLCSFHHTLVHEGGFTVARDADGAFTFHTPRGARVRIAEPSRAGYAEAVVQDNTFHRIHVSPKTGDSRWDGRRADYDLVLTAFFSRPDVRQTLESATH